MEVRLRASKESRRNPGTVALLSREAGGQDDGRQAGRQTQTARQANTSAELLQFVSNRSGRPVCSASTLDASLPFPFPVAASLLPCP
jgi:hypothetical protein